MWTTTIHLCKCVTNSLFVKIRTGKKNILSNLICKKFNLSTFCVAFICLLCTLKCFNGSLAWDLPFPVLFIWSTKQIISKGIPRNDRHVHEKLKNKKNPKNFRLIYRMKSLKLKKYILSIWMPFRKQNCFL